MNFPKRKNIQRPIKRSVNHLRSSKMTDFINDLNQNKTSKKKHNYKNKNDQNISSLKQDKKNLEINYNNYELNTFDYSKAILYDKRTCFQYYLSLIKVKNAIIFSFCPMKDYNSLIVRSCIFSLSFSIYYAVNFAFFDDAMLHMIYKLGGKYDFMYFIPKIAISFVISYVI